MFDANGLFNTSEVPSSELGGLESTVFPCTFTVQQEYGIWCAQFSQCAIPQLIREFSLMTGRCDIVKIDVENIPGFPPPAEQWIDNPAQKQDIPDLLFAPELALAETNGRVAFIQVDKTHASVFATSVADLFDIWRAWLCQHYPGQRFDIDPHRAAWETHASLLWPHPPGQWSQIRPVVGRTITAFDILDFGWNPEGEVFSRTRTRILKTSDKSWRTGWMW